MGGFAELNIRFKLKEDTPSEVIDVIKYMVGKGEETPQLPDHRFFSTINWEAMLRAFSDDTNIGGHFSYFEKHSRYNYWELCVRSVFRDRNETKSFFDWVHPFIDDTFFSYLGYVVLDDIDEHPYLIYLIDENIHFMKVHLDEQEDIARNDVLMNWSIVDATFK